MLCPQDYQNYYLATTAILGAYQNLNYNYSIIILFSIKKRS